MGFDVPGRGSLRRIHIVVVLAAANLALSAWAQDAPPTEQQRDSILLREWSGACERILAGDPWDEIAADVELSLLQADETTNSELIANHLDGIRKAEEQQPFLPVNRAEATPDELAALLINYRVLIPDPRSQTQAWALITSPLHWHRRTDGRRIHWVELGAQPEHELTDPAIRLFKRGRAAVPALLAALDDMTATRCAILTRSSRRPATLPRRCDLAMAILEAMTRCRFYVTVRNGCLSQFAPADREDIVRLARKWWEQTKDLSELEARSWLMERIEYEQAKPMIEALVLDDHPGRAIRHLRTFLHDERGRLQIAVAERLSVLGDRSVMDDIVDRARRKLEIKSQEIDLLVRFGGRREFVLLGDMVAEDKPINPETNNEISRWILQALKSTGNRLAIPVLARALDVQDEITDQKPRSSRSTGEGSRADIAAKHIQRLTQRNFRYDSQADAATRAKAIRRIGDWWEQEGRGLYGFGSARVRRTGGIR